MLAQNFKRPADLGITDKEFDALAKVLGLLERGEIDRTRLDLWSAHAGPDCGTPMCIVGWARAISYPIEVFQTRDWTGGLGDLFLMDMSDHAIRDISRVGFDGRNPDQAAIALRNYLTHGEPRWCEALADA